MAVDFSKIFATNGGVTVPTDTQYLQGFDFIGSAPPTVELFNYMFQNLDLKVQELRGGLGNQSSFVSTTSTAVALTAANVGNIIYLGAIAAKTVTLPSVSTLSTGSNFYIVNNLEGAATLTANGTETIDSRLGTATTLTLKSGEEILLTNTGTRWFATGSAALRTTSGSASGIFGTSLSTNGYQKLPSGLIIQWGFNQISTAGTTVTYPVAFPHAPLSIVLGQASGNSTPYINTINANMAGTSFLAYTLTATAYHYWLAVGH